MPPAHEAHVVRSCCHRPGPVDGRAPRPERPSGSETPPGCRHAPPRPRLGIGPPPWEPGQLAHAGARRRGRTTSCSIHPRRPAAQLAKLRWWAMGIRWPRDRFGDLGHAIEIQTPEPACRRFRHAQGEREVACHPATTRGGGEGQRQSLVAERRPSHHRRSATKILQVPFSPRRQRMRATRPSDESAAGAARLRTGATSSDQRG